MMGSKDLEGTQLLPLNFSSNENSMNEKFQDNSGRFEKSCSLPKKHRSYNNWSPSEEGVTLVWNDLTIYAPAKINGKRTCKRIINGVTGAVKAGSLVALMGASGAGKSTLMSALAYRNSADAIVDGDILINGRPIGNYMKYLSGFMHQDDIFVGSLTVLEHMTIMTRLKLDRRISKEESNCKIYELLKNVGLMKCLNTKIGMGSESKTLSGGEKKRLAFATELLTDPPILFCDEPTTGLDSFSAQKIISMMNVMASNGKTILCTIHQPSSDIFAMFSQVILLAEGRIAYIGNTLSAINFFDKMGCKCPKSYNPADYFIRTLAISPRYEDNSKQTIKRICDNFPLSDYYKEIDVVVRYESHMETYESHECERETAYKIVIKCACAQELRSVIEKRWGKPFYYFTSLSFFIARLIFDKICTVRTNFKENFWWIKIYWLIHRWFIEILRNPAIQSIRILQKIAIAIMVGLCYFGTDSTTQNGIQSIQGATFVIVTENTFTAMYSVLDEFPNNYPLFLREYKSGLYSPAIYYSSRILAMIPGLIVEPVIFVIIVYFLSGFRLTVYAFLMTNLSAILTMNVATSCGIFFSIAFNSLPVAISVLVPFDNILMITAGLFIKLNTLPLFFSWFKYLSWLMYSMESITIVQWENVTNLTCNGFDLNLPCLTNGTEVMEKYSFSENNLSRDLWSMVVLCITFYVLGFLCLYWKTKRK